MAKLYQADVALAGCRQSCCLTDAAAPGLGPAVVWILALSSQGFVPQPSLHTVWGVQSPAVPLASEGIIFLSVHYIPDTRGVFLLCVPDSASGGEPAA